MTITINEETVRKILRDLRGSRPLNGSEFLNSAALRNAALRESNSADKTARAAVLPRWLEAVTRERMAQLGGWAADPSPPRGGASSLEAVKSDFSSQNREREALGLLYFRYFTESSLTLAEVAARLGVSRRTLRRRMRRGYQLLAEHLTDLEREAERSRTRGHGVPQPLSSFVGRDREMAQIRELLATHRLVALVGPGGIGKSRLAVRLAADLAGDYPDGVWFADLVSVESDAGAGRAVAAALGFELRPGRTTHDQLASFVANKRALLVLDNCEQVLSAVSGLVTPMLTRGRGLQVVVTSRETLDVPGGANWSVPPMSRPTDPSDLTATGVRHFDATRLFVLRAASADPTFDFTEADVPKIGSIVEMLEGIPLAIELAAGRMRHFTVDDLASAFSDRFELLTTRGVGAARPSHATLRATLDLSYQSLTKAEQDFLNRLSVFRGGWDLTAARAVCTGHGVRANQVPDLLRELEAKSQVTATARGDDKRFEMLETIREYVAGHIAASGDEAHWQDRHLSHFVGMTDDLSVHFFDTYGGPPRQPDVDLANLNAAMNWARDSDRAMDGAKIAASLLRFWTNRGRAEEGLSTVTRFMDASSAAWPADLRARLLYAAARLQDQLGDFASARELGLESRGLFDGEANDLGVAACELDLGWRDVNLGDVPGANGRFESARQGFAALDRPVGVAAAQVGKAATSALLGDKSAADVDFQQADAILTELGVENGLAHLRWIRGVMSMKAHSLNAAEEDLTRALDHYRRVGDRWRVAICIQNLASVAQALGDSEAMQRRYRESFEVAQEIGDRVGEAHAIMGQGDAEALLGRLSSARKRWAEGLRMARELQDRHLQVLGLRTVIDADLREGDLESARRHLDEADQVAAEAGFGPLANSLRMKRARLELKAGDPLGARRIIEGCIQECRAEGSTPGQLVSLEVVAEICVEENDLERAATLLAFCEAQRERLGHPRGAFTEARLSALLESVLSRLEPEAAQRASERGSTLALDEAVALATG